MKFPSKTSLTYVTKYKSHTLPIVRNKGSDFLNKIKFIFLSFQKFISENRKMYILGYKKNSPIKKK